LLDQDAIRNFVVPFRTTVAERLRRIRNAFLDMKAEGLPVDSLKSQGTIYLTVRFDILGRKLPDGRTVTTDEDIRRLLLEDAAVAFLPFTAFGLPHDTGWARLSVGAIDDDEIDRALERIRTVLGRLD